MFADLSSPWVIHLAQVIHQATQRPFQIDRATALSGGDINEAYQIQGSDQTYFVKLNRADRAFMFAAESHGLKDIADTKTIRVPQPICHGSFDRVSYLVLEHLELGRSGNAQQFELGQQLARLHRASGSSAFGWSQDNTIGSTPQPNPWTANWAEFWQKHRIGYQLNLAQSRGGSFLQSEQLLDRIPDLLKNHNPRPSLVHGDLWGGNAGALRSGEPVIYDPAVYWGDREVDLAMTELFGGFSKPFYEGYNATYPLEPGYHERKTLYNLYHILNHFNLFGSSYAGQANRMIQQLLA